ncbi:hypothetical protein BLNAU_18753 [Blattamonas nauphoetae]|uniref:Uncharacterized protein n=1 Tax=Blattamonas nauphoetae TaxID=2049346 RepID=A0ABQ9X3Z3_9EUKA|nr:hypothetical protein BLNAU_18753 [Blattamonas nauphoetae]
MDMPFGQACGDFDVDLPFFPFQNEIQPESPISSNSTPTLPSIENNVPYLDRMPTLLPLKALPCSLPYSPLVQCFTPTLNSSPEVRTSRAAPTILHAQIVAFEIDGGLVYLNGVTSQLRLNNFSLTIQVQGFLDCLPHPSLVSTITEFGYSSHDFHLVEPTEWSYKSSSRLCLSPNDISSFSTSIITSNPKNPKAKATVRLTFNVANIGNDLLGRSVSKHVNKISSRNGLQTRVKQTSPMGLACYARWSQDIENSNADKLLTRIPRTFSFIIDTCNENWGRMSDRLSFLFNDLC